MVGLLEAIKNGEKSKEQVKRELKGMGRKARLQITKDYIVFPVLSGLAAAAVDAVLTSVASGKCFAINWLHWPSA